MIRAVESLMPDVMAALEKARAAAQLLPQKPTPTEGVRSCWCGHLATNHGNVSDASVPPRQIGSCLVSGCRKLVAIDLE